MEKLIIETEREGYATDQVEKTMTVGELIELLHYYDEDAPVYLSFDGGYTYGGLRAGRFDLQEDEPEEEEYDDESDLD